MKTRAIYLLAAAALLAGCTREMITPEGAPQGAKTVLEIGLPDTKTTLGDKNGSNRKVYWSDGDCIAVNGVESDALSGVPAQSTTALFSFTGSLSAPYRIAYPASVWKDDTSIILPATQEYVSGTFANGALPMIGYAATGSSPSLSHVCAVVKASLVLSSGESIDKDKIESISFKGNSGEQVSGEFTVDFQNASITGKTATAGSNAVTVPLGKTLSTDNPLEVYIVVPAGSYASGFSLTVTDVNGHYMKKSNGGAVELQAGHIYVLPDLAFEPSGTELSIDIASANDLVAFAQDYNDGKYYGSVLRANVVSDISFDANTSNAFSATGGIGCKTADGDNYFNGTFDGGGHTISGYTGSCPLFGYTGSNGIVKALNIDSSCSYTFTHSNAADNFFAAVVGYNRGQIDGVSVSANMTISDASVEFATYFGGIAGRVVVGKISNSKFSGSLAVGSGFVSNEKPFYIGGITGAITNVAGLVDLCSFEGTIDYAARVISTDKSDPTLLLGGIAGSSAGTVSNCYTSSNPAIQVYTSDTATVYGTIGIRTTQTYHMAEGGIVGRNMGSVDNCTNSAELSNFVTTTGVGGEASDDNGRYMYVGGIAGYNTAEGSVSASNNMAHIVMRCTPRHQKVGGVVGYNKGSVSGSDNFGDLGVATAGVGPFGVRLLRLGGVVGEHTGSSAVVSAVRNNGALSVTRIENNSNTDTAIGGVIGLAASGAVIDPSSQIYNHGDVSFANGNTTNVSALGYSVGGVVGHSSVSVCGVSNDGNITYTSSANGALSNLWLGGIVGYLSDEAAELSNNLNGGEVNFKVSKDAAHTNNSIGGIAGRVAVPVQSYYCINRGYVHGGNTTKHNGASLILGGIIGYLQGGSSVYYASNEGPLHNDQFNNSIGAENSTYEGGIVGYCAGTSDARISIQSSNSSAISYTGDPEKPATGPRRGYCGGIAGYAACTSISDCTNTGDYLGSSFYHAGGIAGWAVNSTISGCKYLGSAMASTQIQTAGGIVAVLDAGTSVTGCYSSLETVTPAANACVFGAVAGKSVEGSSISKCHYKAALAICSDTNFYDGGDNVADL